MRSSTMTSDGGGLRAFFAAFAAAAACVGLAYVHPALAEYRPWTPGDPLPVLAALAPRVAARVVEDDRDGLSLAVPLPASASAARTDPPALDAPLDAPLADRGLPAPPLPAPPLPARPLPALPARPPGVATALVDRGDRGMDPFYRALHRAKAGQGIARAAHYGDSTIAADGITSTVRARLQARFGNGGPGYLSAGMDPRWNMRADVGTGRTGDWETVSLLLGGGGGRYGYGGIVSTAAVDASLSITSPKGADGKPTPMQRFELWYQSGPERGAWWASLDGAGVGQGSAVGEGVTDRRFTRDAPAGYTRASFGASEGPVSFYGAVMETAGPGVVWDALGVVGVGSRSFTQHNRKHLAAQIAQRRPDLVVVMLGGNELGLPVLGKGDGSAYIPYYQDAVRRLRDGAPTSACLLITPLDQGTRDGGTPRTKPTLARLVDAQRRAAEQEGCAFWNAFGAMGGADTVVRWAAMKPPLAWTDLVHLSTSGQRIVGDLLADAIEGGYDAWLAGGGPARPAPPHPAPPPAPPAPAKP